MNRRAVLKALTGVAAATGTTMTPTYITAQDVAGVDVVILTFPSGLTVDQAIRMKQEWEQSIKGTVLEHTRAICFTADVRVELIRTPSKT